MDQLSFASLDFAGKKNARSVMSFGPDGIGGADRIIRRLVRMAGDGRSHWP